MAARVGPAAAPGEWTRSRWFERIAQASGMGTLAVRTIRLALAPPYPWTRDLVVQCSLAVRRCAIPVALSTAAFLHGAGTVVTGGILGLIGAEDRLGFGLALAADREVCAWVTGMILAGIAGTAMCSDLGARKIREELDALSVLGVEPVRSLVVPRVLALVLMAPVLGLLSLIAAGLVAGMSSVLLLEVPLAVYMESFASAITAPDIVALVLKLMLFGLLVGVVSCHKGLTAAGGAEGVGRAVNQAVIITFAGVWILDWVFNLIFFAAFPEIQTLR